MENLFRFYKPLHLFWSMNLCSSYLSVMLSLGAGGRNHKDFDCKQSTCPPKYCSLQLQSNHFCIFKKTCNYYVQSNNNIHYFSPKIFLIQEHAFKPVTVDHLEVHFVLEGNLFYQDSTQDYQLKEGLSEGCYQNLLSNYSCSHYCFVIICVVKYFLHWCSTHREPQEVIVNVIYEILLQNMNMFFIVVLTSYPNKSRYYSIWNWSTTWRGKNRNSGKSLCSSASFVEKRSLRENTIPL